MDQATTQSELQQLSRKIAELVALTRKLDEENRQLRAKSHQLEGEHLALISKNDLARQRIEAMITRLKAMEQA